MNVNEIVPVEVRGADIGDATELSRLRWEHCLELGSYPKGEDGAEMSREKFGEAFEAFLRQALASGHWAIWLAEAGGEAVGTLSLETVTALPTPWQTRRAWGYVTSVQVDLPWRTRGVGRRLMETALDWARGERLEVLHLWPSPDSVPFYEQLGFLPAPHAMERYPQS